VLAIFDSAGGMKRTSVVFALFAIANVTGCSNCESCKQIPGWDGRYATHDRGANNREDRRGLPVTPYVPQWQGPSSHVPAWGFRQMDGERSGAGMWT
jgi:hypothetical protein